MNEDTTVSFDEFLELCQEAGISSDNVEVLEQDFRSGRALAEVTDALITDQELHPAKYTGEEALEAMDVALTLVMEGENAEANRKQMLKIAVHALRYIAENCHDEGKN